MFSLDDRVCLWIPSLLLLCSDVKFVLFSQQSRRCDSGSDGVYPLPDSPLQRPPPRLSPLKTSSPLPPSACKGLVKSGSFSGTPAFRRPLSTDRLSCSDPSALGLGAAHRRSARVVSSTETDEEDGVATAGVGGKVPGLPVPVFRLGPEEGVISVASMRARRRAGMGSDVEKLSIHSTEQASWDSYQVRSVPSAERMLFLFLEDYIMSEDKKVFHFWAVNLILIYCNMQ